MRKFRPLAPFIAIVPIARGIWTVSAAKQVETAKNGMRVLLALSLFCFAGIPAHGQEKRPDNFSVSGGIGFFYYVNTLNTRPDRVGREAIGLSARLMWEPEHRFSLGGELGYYTIYTVKIDSGKANSPIGEARLSAIPVLLCFRMRITRHIYFTGGQGFSVLVSRVTSFGNTVTSTQLSLADAQLSEM